jgi:hypothetical protein
VKLSPMKIWPKIWPKMWRVLGVAGLAGVAATGAIIARDQRRRAQLTPEQVRERLHERLAETPGA